MTAVTVIDGAMVEILDVEKVLDQVVHASTAVNETLTANHSVAGNTVLVVDDSSVARNQIRRALEQIGVECETAEDGKAALTLLQQMEQAGIDPRQHIKMIISDIEMPEMDGYMLTTALRSQPRYSDIYILLHSSISGEFNMDMLKKTGANRFIQKYDPNDLAEVVLQQLSAQNSSKAQSS